MMHLNKQRDHYTTAAPSTKYTLSVDISDNRTDRWITLSPKIPYHYEWDITMLCILCIILLTTFVTERQNDSLTNLSLIHI